MDKLRRSQCRVCLFFASSHPNCSPPPLSILGQAQAGIVDAIDQARRTIRLILGSHSRILGNIANVVLTEYSF